MINWPAIIYFPWVRFYRPELTIPKVTVSKLSEIELEKLKSDGIKGVLIDYDDTLAISGTNELSFDGITFAKQCLNLWGDRAVIFSNTVGTSADKNNSLSKDVEAKLGMKVLRHKELKPWGFDDVKKYYGDDVGELAIIGDRIFTDVVFGNVNKIKTIWLKQGKPGYVWASYEQKMLNRWFSSVPKQNV